MSKTYPDHEDRGSDRYERLEELLRQTLTLAGEIAEDEGRPLPGECIIVRRRSDSDPGGGNRQDIRSRLLKRRKALKFDASEDSQSQSQSPASSVQEPFSPGSLAVSLDAVVEKGKTSDNDLCVLDNASATSAVARFAEPLSNRSSLPSTDEGQHGLAAQTPLPQLLVNANAPKRLLRPSLPQKNTSMIVHSGQESLVEASTETCVPQQNIENPRHDRPGRCRTPAHESPQGSPARSRTPKSHQNSDTVLKRSQKIEDERLKGEAAAANQPSPPKWHIRIVPVAPSRDSGSLTPSSPALMKLEAVFPLKISAEGNATSSLACNGEPSYILISRPPMDPSPDSLGPRADEEDILITQEKSLQEFIHEWQYDAESPAAEERKL
ncbi:hypothetical protein LA080_008920 [Diaporthe eres]|uniref:Uncharacterized protein n=1 Tax=Diaporthe vaccinii TaxID=105482 RepID=A0ABR4ECB6_9PEZI|nr:hypothetical protein LA080_008920 [Diaporthe eres]